MNKRDIIIKMRSLAADNLEKWGVQDEKTLLLAMIEELGELTQAYLQSVHEGGDPARITAEAIDIGALCYQFQNADVNQAFDIRAISTYDESISGYLFTINGRICAMRQLSIVYPYLQKPYLEEIIICCLKIIQLSKNLKEVNKMTKNKAIQVLTKWRDVDNKTRETSRKGSEIAIRADAMAAAHDSAINLIKSIDSLD